MAVVGAVFQKPNFSDLTFDIGDGVVFYGRFLTAVVNFLIIGAVMFFVVRAVQRFFRTAEPEPTAEVRLLTEIRDELRRRP